jgi:hypothetical protein
VAELYQSPKEGRMKKNSMISLVIVTAIAGCGGEEYGPAEVETSAEELRGYTPPNTAAQTQRCPTENPGLNKSRFWEAVRMAGCLYKTVPEFRFSGGSSSTLTNGETEAYALQGRAVGEDSVGIAQISFELYIEGGPNLKLLSIELFDTTYDNNEVSLSGVDFSERVSGRVVQKMRFNSPIRMWKGNYLPKSFSLRIDVRGAYSTESGVICTRMISDTEAPSVGAFGTLNEIIKDEASNLVWSDISDRPHSETSRDWTNGFRVKNIPSTIACRYY